VVSSFWRVSHCGVKKRRGHNGPPALIVQNGLRTSSIRHTAVFWTVNEWSIDRHAVLIARS
jgi:hypothetical protein